MAQPQHFPPYQRSVCLHDEDVSPKTLIQKYGQLKWAITNGRKETAESLLEQNVPVNACANGYSDLRSPLHFSVYLEDLELVKKLLDNGASVNVLNCNEETPLMIAAKMEKNAMVDLLLTAADLKNVSNRENLTHLHIACMRNQVNTVIKLTKCSEDLAQYVKINSIRWSGFTPLHFAVRFCCIETVQFLLSAGAEITAQDVNQLTPLHWADMLRDEQIMDILLLSHRDVVSNPVKYRRLISFSHSLHSE
ncbi:hypothetical protein QAD02_009686 [Eretmocerus hayati]|uniref:Uncharacterized protein n=1 Tax=Eretmocerus hayati TaxID=131215 RepID=A0ACC2NAR0_9HYME|nr:hypothetical protein QAD02_009686 [Eretmocerus hayati]